MCTAVMHSIYQILGGLWAHKGGSMCYESQFVHEQSCTNACCRWLCSLTGLGLVENKCFGHSEQLSAPLSVLVALRYSWAVFFLPAQPFTHVLYTAWAAWVLARNGYREAVLTYISPPKERHRAQPSAPSQYMQVLSWQPAKCHWQARIKQN